MGEGLGPAPNDMTDFEDSLWKASPSLGSKKGMGWGLVGVREEGKKGSGIGINMKNKLVSNLNKKKI